MSEVKITAADVKTLRDQSGAGMLDCKKALVEAEGSIEKAIEILRKTGQKLSAKRADRDANEGAVIALVSEDRSKGVVLRLSCETDFVAKNDDFVALTTKFANVALDQFPVDIEALLQIAIDGKPISEIITEQVGVIGEKLELKAYEKMEATYVTPYTHMGNRAGVIVGFNKASGDFDQAGKDVAMQIAAMKPVAVDQSGVDQDIIAKEIEIGKDIARQEGKPEDLIERIAQGKLGKFFKENTLLPQAFVKNNKQSVAQYLQSFDKELTVTDFKHVKLG